MINKINVDKFPLKGWGSPLWAMVVGIGLLGMVQEAAGQRAGAGPGAQANAGPVRGVAEYFQGSCVYRVSVRSKVEDLNDQDIHKVLTVGDLLTVTMKGGNYKLSTEYADTYIIKDDRKEYIKFRKIDTVFYLDFDSDTDRVTGIVRNNTVVEVGGFSCKGVTIETSKVSRQYYYSTKVRTNPEDDKHDMLAQAAVYAVEAGGGLKVWIRTDYPYAIEVDSCIRVESRRVSNAVFRLPDLPISALFSAPRILFPRFPGGDSAWKVWVAATVNPKLAERYVKIPRGEKEAWQTVILEFAVAADGTVSAIRVTNPDEVDPRLAEEAMRVMRLSPKWVSATFYGEAVKWTCQQGIEFDVVATGR
jgi:hypothetical protein